MNEYLVTKLREGRINKNLKQSDVTKYTGIKNTTLSNYENGITEPDIDTFLQLCELYELDYAYILGEAYGLGVQGSSFTIKPSEIDHIKKYRNLDDFGRQRIDYELDTETERVKEISSIALGDGSINIFLNACSSQDDVSTELRAFLDYVAGYESDDAFVQELKKAVNKAKKNREWRREYMTLLMRDQDNIEKGLQQGLQQGMEERRKADIKRMLEIGRGVEQIVDFCGYDKSEVEAVQKSLECCSQEKP